MNPPLQQPPENCPNGEICIEEEIQRRRASDRNVWIRWSLGIALSVLGFCVAGLLGRVSAHGDKIIEHGAAITTLKDADAEMKAAEKIRREEDQSWKRRIEEKIDRLVERRR
jgi:hypothetical protein